MGRIIFYVIFSSILNLLSLYIFIRGLQSLPSNSIVKYTYAVVFWIIALSFMAGQLLENVLPPSIAHFFIWIGSFWIAAMLYFLIAVVSLDLIRLVNHFLPFFPAFLKDHYSKAKYVTSAVTVGFVCLLLLGGYVNSVIPRIKKLNLTVAKKASGMKSLNIVAVTDIHLGVIVGRSRVDSIVNKINSLNPDLVLLPGDIVDSDLAPVIRQNIGDALKNLKSRYGIFGATGNHEHIGGVEKACAYLTEHNIVMLRDQSVKIGNSFYIMGREDFSAGRFDGGSRKPLSALMAAVDKKYPVILMDHQPFGLEEAAKQGADLQISGHTHYGQLWPLNYIVKSVYELPWGYKKIGDTYYYVSSGVGTWGPPVRIGNHPEILQIRLNFKE